MTSSDKEKIFKEALKKHKSQIHRVCWGFTNSAEDVKDLYQDVVINIWKGLEGFRNQSSLSTWLHRITINTCLLWKKKKKSVLSFQSNMTDLQVENEYEFKINENPQLKALKKAIDKLKPVDKSLILLVLEELSYKEIAEITGLSISNIGVKINRIKTRIKNLMAKNICYE